MQRVIFLQSKTEVETNNPRTEHGCIFVKMARFNQPVPLFKQAMDAVARFFVDVGLHLAKSVESSTSDKRNVELTDQICVYMQDMFHNKVCRVLANDFTATMLKCIHRLYCQNWQWMTEKNCDSVLQGLVNAAIHPEITKLDLDPIVEYVVPKIYNKMSMMTNLVELKLTYLNCEDEDLVINGLKHLKHLKLFSFHVYCTDKIVCVLTQSCGELKCFDVCGSQKVTDLSVPNIAKWKHMEEVNVTDTSISDDGLSELLSNLSEHEGKITVLKSFQGSHVSTENLKLLVIKFPHLTQIGLRSFSQCDMSVLKDLKELKILRLENGCFLLIHSLLAEIGSNLSLLELMDVSNIDVNIVSDSCPNIEDLTIASYEIYSNSPEYEVSDKSLCGFKSLKKLTVFEPEDPPFMGYILSKCVNVKTVHMTVGPGFDDSMMKSVLKRNPLSDLEEMSLYSQGSNLTFATVRNLVEHCPKLNILRGIQSWKCNDLEEFLLEAKKLFPGVVLCRK